MTLRRGIGEAFIAMGVVRNVGVFREVDYQVS